MKTYTDIEQSKELAKFLPIESADMYYYTANGELYRTPNVIESADDLYVDEESVPCWSLAALFEVLPKIYNCKPMIDLEEISIQYDGVDLYIIGEDLVDTCYEMILKLHELKKL